MVSRPGVAHPQAARGPRLDDADRVGEPLPDGARTLRCDVLPGVLAVVRHHGDRRLAYPLQRVLLGLRPPAHPAHHLEWRRRKPYRWLRQILPDPKYAPGYLNEFGGHFQITEEMRDHAEKVQERIRARQP